MLLIKDLLKEKASGQEVTVEGWIKSKRESKNLIFLSINDGSCLSSIQVTVDRNATNLEDELKSLSTGASCKVMGKLQPSPSSGQAVEVFLSSIERSSIIVRDLPLKPAIMHLQLITVNP